MLEPFATEFKRYRTVAERTLEQVSDEALNRIPYPEGNSMAMLVRHVTGNLISRFSDFLTSDGEKPWRDRDAEFEERSYTRMEVDEMWRQAWSVLERTLQDLTPSDLNRTVRIRGQEISVHDAIARSLAHFSYHVGQMVLLGRMEQGQTWRWISIPKGQSEQYNRAPAKERSPEESR